VNLFVEVLVYASVVERPKYIKVN